MGLEKLSKNKKAMFLTIITITILSLFAASYTTYTLLQDRSSTSSRISTLNNFVNSLEKDMPRQIYISGYRAVFIMGKQISDTSSYIEDPEDSLNELFFNATLYGESQDLMEDATFSKMESFLNSNAQKINANISLQNPQISISQTDPWNLKVTFTAILKVQDKSGLVEWNKTSLIESFIPVTSFEDPVYYIKTGGKITQKINKSDYKNFVSGSNYSNLTTHFENSLYKESPSAPNFLMRLQGNLSSDPNGIESLVNPQSLSAVGLDVKYKSLIDYIYFSDEDPQSYSIPTIPNLIIDNESNHLEIYNVSSVAVPI